MTTYFVILLLFGDYGTMGLWDYATTRPTEKEILVVSLSRRLDVFFGLWDSGTMGLCDDSADKYSALMGSGG